MSKIGSLFYRNNKLKKNKKPNRIILNNPEDLLKIPKEDFDKINVSNLYGDYYDQIYKEALEIEEKNAKLKNKKKIKKKNNIKNIKNKTINGEIIHTDQNGNHQSYQTSPLKSILKSNQRERLQKRNVNSKTRSKSKEKNLLIKNHNHKSLAHQFNLNIINGVNDKKHLLSPESPPKMQSFVIQKDKVKNNNNSKIIKNSVNINLYHKKKLETNLTPTFNELKNNNHKKIGISQKNENSINDNKSMINYIKKQNDEVKKNKNMVNQNVINKIIFYIRYDSNYGDNIGILGSIDQLGNWSQDKILYLRWNKGNIWKGEIVLLDSNITKFEFKFINRHDGIIYWEKGLNNVIDLNALIEELRHHKKGRFNKFEYSYDINNFELTLICKIKGWE